MSNITSLQEIHVLANSIGRTYHRLRHTTDQIHSDVEISAPKRTLLMDIEREGPQTVPMLASLRYVSRQIIQTQVNELLELKYLVSKDNPGHKRSSLIALTRTGKQLVKRMQTAEIEYLKQLKWLPDPDDLSKCLEVLDRIYEKLEV